MPSDAGSKKEMNEGISTFDILHTSQIVTNKIYLFSHGECVPCLLCNNFLLNYSFPEVKFCITKCFTGPQHIPLRFMDITSLSQELYYISRCGILLKSTEHLILQWC